MEAWLDALRSTQDPERAAIKAAYELSSVDEWYRCKAFRASQGLSAELNLFSPTRYVRLSSLGVFKYRRGIPTALQDAAGRKEIVQTLNTTDRHTAEIRALKIHGDVEVWLKALKLAQDAGSLESVVTRELALTDKWYRGSAFLESLGVSSTRLQENELDEPAGREPQKSGARYGIRARGLEAQALMRARRGIDPTLPMALESYLGEHRERIDAMPPLERRAWIADKERTVRDLRDALGDEFTLSTLSRQHAWTFAVYLKARGLRPPSVARSIRIAAAIVEVCLREFGINLRNSFHEFTVRDPLSAGRKRLPFGSDELRTVLALPVPPELSTIVTVLIFTGARLREITGVAWEDVRGLDDHQAFLELRPNQVRNLKTAWSARAVPLLAPAAAVLREHRTRSAASSRLIDVTGPVFPKYGRDGGSAAASSALMRALRQSGITDRRKSVHSLRHTVKQRLRDVGVPKDIRDAVQGHAAPNVAETYGLGTALTVMREALERAFHGF